MRDLKQLFLYVFIAGYIVSCGPSFNSSNPSNQSNVRPEGTEAAYNATSITYSVPTVSINATVSFKRYSDYNRDVQALAISYAEFHIYNSAGQIVQAGETGASGEISGYLPKNAGSYTLAVNTRSNNAQLMASILNNPYDKQYYSLKYSFTLSGSETNLNLGQVTAEINTEKKESAAFNILYNLLLANQFLRTQVKTDQCPAGTSCTYVTQNFTVAPKVQVYWTKGLTPAVYLNATGPISYYVPESSGGVYTGLYILGGIDDDLCVDTDHFDNSVILHEYGHFLEKAFSRSDSPGGSHNGQKIIDPRLAWSEGWANFFQGIVLNRNYYRDTTKIDCSSTIQYSFTDFPLEQNVLDLRDRPYNTGEGNFREISVSRLLYNTVATPGNSADTTGELWATAPIVQITSDAKFINIWNAFLGLKMSALAGGRSSHFINYFLKSDLSGNGVIANSFTGNENYLNPGSAPLTREKQRATLNDWTQQVTTQSSVCPTNTDASVNSSGYWTFLSGSPKADESLNGSLSWSDMFNSNDFYLYYHDGNQTTLSLEYKSVNSSEPYNLDLFLYTSSFIHLNNEDKLKKSESYYAYECKTCAPGFSGYEAIDLAGLPAGHYYLNIKVDQPNLVKSETQYRLMLGSQFLCPHSP